jgi:hypothetical protein
VAEGSGRRPRWTVVLLAAPGTAAAFAAVTAWAVHVQPPSATVSTAAAPRSTASAQADGTASPAASVRASTDVRLMSGVLAGQERQLQQLQQRLKSLSVQVSAMASASRHPAASPAPGAVGSGGSPTAGASGTPSYLPAAGAQSPAQSAAVSPAPQQTPVVVTQPPATTSPPPPVQTTTGASGGGG